MKAPKARTSAACLASVEQESRDALFIIRRDDGTCIEVERAELDAHARAALIARVRRADLAENVGAIGIIAATFALLWMLRKCAPSLFPALFQ